MIFGTDERGRGMGDKYVPPGGRGGRQDRNDELTIRVSHLSADATEHDVRLLFEPCGESKSIQHLLCCGVLMIIYGSSPLESTRRPCGTCVYCQAQRNQPVSWVRICHFPLPSRRRVGHAETRCEYIHSFERL